MANDPGKRSARPSKPTYVPDPYGGTITGRIDADEMERSLIEYHRRKSYWEKNPFAAGFVIGVVSLGTFDFLIELLRKWMYGQ